MSINWPNGVAWARISRRTSRVGIGLLASLVLVAPMAGAQADPSAAKAKMKALGLQHDSAWDLYQYLKKQAGGGQRLTWQKVPDWGGVYTRTKGGTAFDPDGPSQGTMPTAKFTPEFHKRLMKTVADRKAGIEYDPLSQCVPPGHPRWLDLPFLREHIVTPDQTTMIAEAFNSVRRIYTDGRDHVPEEDRYPTENGDSIGFWDGDKLVIHTNQLMAHMYTKQSYTKLTDPDKRLRIRHWACKGNPNNDVIETREGGSDFKDLTFTDKDDNRKGDGK